MALFKSKQDNPPADPPDPGSGGGDPPAPQYMTMDQFQEQIKPLQETLSTVNESLKAMNTQRQQYQQPAQPAVPAEDPHKTQKERIKQIDAELATLADKADDATFQGKGMADLLKRQNQLYVERSEVQGQIYAGQRDPRIDAGIQTIDALSTEVTLAKMPHLAVPQVKDRYEHYIQQLPPDQRMNPQSKIGCYNLAVGENLTTIQDAAKQQWLRESEEPPPQAPPQGSMSGRQQATQPGEITPEMAFSPEALKSIKQSRHRNVENYVRSLGYDGWTDYVEKNKEYLIEQEEGA